MTMAQECENCCQTNARTINEAEDACRIHGGNVIGEKRRKSVISRGGTVLFIILKPV